MVHLLYIYVICVIMCVLMNRNLTVKQKQVLVAIRDLKKKFGNAPTLEEIRKTLGYAGVSSLQRHIGALKKKGYLSNERYEARTLEASLPEQMISIPLVGNVACGIPFLAIENIEAYIPYNASKLQGTSDDYFFLRAVGDSMDNTSISGKTIDDGDFVLVKKQQTANSGDRVVALIGDEATIKKMVPDEGHILLLPESTNSRNKPILMFEDFYIQGVVEDVIKKGGD